jgi:glycosyltransferase involved in cell wall biosynthesis
MPKVSIIVPNYNHARFLPQRLDSILGQSFQDFELILLDDCSTDESRLILNQYRNDPKVRIEFNSTNSGSTFKQWNKGVQLSQGEHVWIAESDDYAEAELLQRLVQVLDNEQEVTFAYCRSWRIMQDGERRGFADSYLTDTDPLRWTVDFRVDGREECRRNFVHVNPVPNASAVVFRKCIYERVGGADERFLFCGDWKLWASMALEGRIAYLSQPLNYYRERSETVRSKAQRGRGAGEYLEMVQWMSRCVTPSATILEKAYSMAAIYWIPIVMNRTVPFGQRSALVNHAKSVDPSAMRRLSAHWVPQVLNRRIPFLERWALLSDARAFDSGALWRLLRSALVAVRLKLARHYRQVQQLFETDAP